MALNVTKKAFESLSSREDNKFLKEIVKARDILKNTKLVDGKISNDFSGGLLYSIINKATGNKRTPDIYNSNSLDSLFDVKTGVFEDRINDGALEEIKNAETLPEKFAIFAKGYDDFLIGKKQKKLIKELVDVKNNRQGLLFFNSGEEGTIKYLSIDNLEALSKIKKDLSDLKYTQLRIDGENSGTAIVRSQKEAYYCDLNKVTLEDGAISCDDGM